MVPYFVPFVLLLGCCLNSIYAFEERNFGNVETKEEVKENPAPVIIMPNNYSIQPIQNGCVIIVKHDLTKHGMEGI